MEHFRDVTQSNTVTLVVNWWSETLETMC